MEIMCLVNDSIVSCSNVPAKTAQEIEIQPKLVSEQEQPIPVSPVAHHVKSQEIRPARKQVRRVSFNEKEIITQVNSSATMTQQERNEVWYPQEELMQFKNEARDQCRKMRIHDLMSGMDPETHVVPHTDGNNRGLEHRVSVERQKNKLLAIRAVLKAQSRYPESPEHVATIASRCTAWARQVALLTGHQDYYHAYQPSLIHLVPSAVTVEFPFATNKRQREPEQHHHQQQHAEPLRRTRPRLAPGGPAAPDSCFVSCP